MIHLNQHTYMERMSIQFSLQNQCVVWTVPNSIECGLNVYLSVSVDEPLVYSD